MSDESLNRKSSADIHAIQRNPRTLYLLLVEDNPADAELFQELLELIDDFKFVSHHVDTLSSAVNEAQTKKFDCIILDLNLPDSQGIDTYKAMRQHATATAIVILSGQSDRDVMLDAIRHGADNYLIKGSCDGNRIAIAILSAMRSYLEQHKQDDSRAPIDIDHTG